MNSDEDYKFDLDTVVPVKKNHRIEYERKRANSPSSSENGDDDDIPPMLSLIHAMDIPSVHRPPVSVMVPADRVSAHDLPLAETLSAVKGELFHNNKLSIRTTTTKYKIKVLIVDKVCCRHKLDSQKLVQNYNKMVR